MILWKNTLSLFRYAKQSKNGVLTSTMWNIIDLSNISESTDLINIVLFISNGKLADPAMFLLS